MSVTRRIFISGPRGKYLDPRRKSLWDAIRNEIVRLGFEPTAFGTAEGGIGLADTAWSPEKAIDAMRRCVGVVLLGFPYWQARRGTEECSLVSEYCHYEGALAAMLGLPVFALLEAGTRERVSFLSHGGDPVFELPAEAEADWVQEPGFQQPLRRWAERLAKRSDVFLGFSSGVEEIAAEINRFLEQQGITVVNWLGDSKGGGNVLDNVKDAAASCTGGIFLFTKDDWLESKRGRQPAPRDNLVFEAGFFMHAKGEERVLIIREGDTRMPSDLGGYIFLPFERGATGSVLEAVGDFVRGRL